MSVIEIRGRSAAAKPRHSRTACRGIVLREGRILLSYERNTDQYVIPGGGMEEGECPGDCCVREVAEETGVLTSTHEPVLTFREFYGDWCWVNHYFLCRIVGVTERKLTSSEAENGLEPRWLPLADAFALFGGYETLEGWKRGSYFRDFTALQKIISPLPASAPGLDGL